MSANRPVLARAGVRAGPKCEGWTLRQEIDLLHYKTRTEKTDEEIALCIGLPTQTVTKIWKQSSNGDQTWTFRQYSDMIQLLLQRPHLSPWHLKDQFPDKNAREVLAMIGQVLEEMQETLDFHRKQQISYICPLRSPRIQRQPLDILYSFPTSPPEDILPVEDVVASPICYDVGDLHSAFSVDRVLQFSRDDTAPEGGLRRI